LLDQAQRRDLRVTALDVRNSGDTRGPRDRVVGYGAFAFEYAHAAQLDANIRQALLKIAHETIRQSVLHNGALPKLQTNGPLPRVLRAQRATFVTIKIGNALRGCRGSLLPHRPLIDDILENTWKSAFEDPRFPPLTPAEAEQVHLHVSILSTP